MDWKVLQQLEATTNEPQAKLVSKQKVKVTVPVMKQESTLAFQNAFSLRSITFGGH